MCRESNVMNICIYLIIFVCVYDRDLNSIVVVDSQIMTSRSLLSRRKGDTLVRLAGHHDKPGVPL